MRVGLGRHGLSDRGVEATRDLGREGREGAGASGDDWNEAATAGPECDAGDAAERHRTEIGGDNLRRFNLQHWGASFRLLVSGTDDDVAERSLDTNEFRGGGVLDSLAHGADRVPVAARHLDGRI